MSTASILFTFQNARGNFADLPTLADGQLFWCEDTQQLFIGTAADGNIEITAGGGGSSVKVNGSDVSDPNFNGTTPAAPGGNRLITFQVDGSGNVSAYIPSSLPPNGSAGGDLNGTYPNPAVAKVNGGSIPTSKTIVGTDSSGRIVDATSATLSNNTSGTAANLSGTPALPNGTTATTQSAGDSSTKLATTKFVQDAQTVIRQDYTLSDTDLINSGTTMYTLVTPAPNQIVVPVSALMNFTSGSLDYQLSQGVYYGYTNVSGFFTPWLTMRNLIGALDESQILLAMPATASDNAVTIGQPFGLEAYVGGGPIVTYSLGSSPGSGYAPGDDGYLQAGNQDAHYVVDTVDGGGGVLTFHIDIPGTGYSVETDVPTVPNTGSGDGTLFINVDSVTLGNGTATLTLLYYLINT